MQGLFYTSAMAGDRSCTQTSLLGNERDTLAPDWALHEWRRHSCLAIGPWFVCKQKASMWFDVMNGTLLTSTWACSFPP